VEGLTKISGVSFEEIKQYLDEKEYNYETGNFFMNITRRPLDTCISISSLYSPELRKRFGNFICARGPGGFLKEYYYEAVLRIDSLDALKKLQGDVTIDNENIVARTYLLFHRLK